MLRIKATVFSLAFLLIEILSIRGQHLKYTVEQGLPHQSVTDLVGDSGGRLWVVADERQVVMFDGGGFQAPAAFQNAPFQRINRLVPLKGGLLLVCTSQGLYEYDGVHLKALPLDSKRELEVFSVLEDSAGRLWAGTEQGVYLRQAREWENFSRRQGWPESPVLSLLEDSRARVWFGGESGLWKLEGNKASLVRYEKGWKGRSVVSMAEDASGRMWFATRDDGILVWKDEKLEQWTSRQGLLEKSLHRLYKDKKRNIWVAYQNGGANCWKESDGKFHSVPGLGSRIINCFAEDAFGQFWFGTNDGLWLYRPGEFQITSYFTEPIGTQAIYAVLKDSRGRFWVGKGKNGAGFVESGIFHNVLEGTPFARAVIRNIFEDSKGNIWLASEDTGLALYTPEGKLVTFTPEDGFPHPNTTGLGEDKEGNIWAGTWGSGLVRLTPQTDSPKGYSIKRIYRSARFPDRLIQTLVIDPQNRLWVATRRHGVVLLENGKTSTIYDRKKGLPSDNARDLWLDPSGRLWVATPKGVAYLPLNEPTPRLQPLLGLRTRNLFALLLDREGALWLASTDQLERVELSPEGKAGHRQVFEASDGFFGATTSPNTAVLDAEGLLWFGSKKGLIRVRRRTSDAPNPLPLARIGAWEAQVTGPEPDSVFTPLPFGVKEAGFQVPPGTQRLRLHLEVSAPVGIQPRIRWRMDQVQDEWSPPLEGAILELNDLKKGPYTLEIQAGDGRRWGPAQGIRFDIPGRPLEVGANDQLLTILGLVVLLLLFYALWRRLRKNAEEKFQTLEIENYLLSLEKKSLQLFLPGDFLNETAQSLNTLARQGNVPRLCEFQDKLGAFLRNLSLQAREELITLETEIETLRQFLELAQLNHRQSFDYQIGLGNGLQPSQLYIPSRLLLPFLYEIIGKRMQEAPAHRKKIKLTYSKQNTHLEVSLLLSGARNVKTRINGQEAAPQMIQLAEERLNLYNASHPNLTRSVVYRTSTNPNGNPVLQVDFFIPILSATKVQPPLSRKAPVKNP